MTFAYYPLYHWVHEHLAQDKLPLISDLAYNGAPVAAVVMAGILSPVLWLFHVFSSFTVAFNLLCLAPTALYLFGSYQLGQRLDLSRTASLLLAFLWTYNGHQMAQLDHLSVAWAHAFFPWAFLALVEYPKAGKPFWLILASFLFGLNVLSGHPQIVFMEGLFFLAWIFLANHPSTLTPTLSPQGRGGIILKIKTAGGLFAGALLTSSPMLLFTLECRGGESFNLWDSADRFFHSWTPLNFITLVFPWFFGKEQFDRTGTDYWWQYQFVEMQVAFSIVGLFFILLFLLHKNPQRRWIGITALFGLSLAFGKFFFNYALFQKIPIFSFFRDPARYWFLITWVVGLGGAYGWDAWFKERHPHLNPLPSRERVKGKKRKQPSPLGFGFSGTQGPFPVRAFREMGWVRGDENIFSLGRRLAVGLVIFSVSFLIVGWVLLHPGRPLLEGTASWFVSHFLLGDGIHTQPLFTYMARLPEKFNALAVNLDPTQPRVFLPLLFLAGLTLCLFKRQKWNLNFQKAFLLFLILVDLMFFRMPLGNTFYNPSEIPQPAYPAPQNRSLVLLSGNVSPLPNQYGEMAFPNWNFISNRPNIALVANPHLPQYNKILYDLGWFSWVYKDRDPLGFIRHIPLLRALGIDQIVSDKPLALPGSFKTIQEKYPYVYRLSSTMPGAFVINPALVADRELLAIHPHAPPPAILDRKETRLSILTNVDSADMANGGDLLILQKTFLPGWIPMVNGKKTMKGGPLYGALIGIPLVEGKNHVELMFEPVSLRLGFFLFFLFFTLFTFSFLRRLVA